jgi:hypothetical protein
VNDANGCFYSMTQIANRYNNGLTYNQIKYKMDMKLIFDAVSFIWLKQYYTSPQFKEISLIFSN